MKEQPKRDQAFQGDKPGMKQDDRVGQDTDNDGRVVQPGHKPGEIDGDKQRQKQ